ncbi:MAG: hypothetical protein U1D30_19300 [Planctomycetota bacterium]
MPTVLDTLKELHALHAELADVQDQLKRAPLQLKAKEAEVAKREAAVVAGRDAHKRMKMDADSREMSLKSGEAKVADYKLKLNLCKSNKEFSALQEEIKHFQEANGKLEEEILGMMTDVENHAAVVKDLQKQLEESKDELAKLREVIDYKIQKFTDRVTLLEGKIKEYSEQLDSATLADYRRLVKTKGSGALAGCLDGTCEACFTGQTAQSLNELMMGRVVFCKSCGAMLYLK